MTSWGALQIGLAFAAWLALAKPLGLYLARVYGGTWPRAASRGVAFERLIYRLAGVDPQVEMTWRQYASGLLAFSTLGFLAVYGLQRFQAWLPLNPDGRGAVASDSAFNTALSFVTNTNWQGYAGEATMSHLTQMVGLAAQNFLSAATGMAALVAMIRGFVRTNCETIGNFWVDLTRGTLYVLVPLSFLLSLALVSQGVVQTFQAAQQTPLVEPTRDAAGNEVVTQTIPLGPAASQIAIKQLGTNGGGFFNANSAHPLENPTPWSNFCQVVAILLLPVALPITLGELIGERRQGWALLAAMGLVFAPLLALVLWAEQAGNPRLASRGVDDRASVTQAGGNLEGKETRFGIANSALWAVATTAASNGSVNAMHDSFTPLGGLVPLWLIQLGEVIFGGVGSGLYGMVVFALLAVFVAGLMVGRTPEYLGKKINAFEIKMAALAILLPCVVTLVGTAIACVTPAGTSSALNPGPHGFSELLYAFSSAANNNGSAFAGLNANTPYYNGLLGAAMFVGRFGVMIPVLAIGGSLARKKKIPVGSGTLPTDTPLFVFLLVAVVVLVGALSFLPALALGPIAEHLLLWRS